jgi:RNA-directed DNA polymerase
VKHKTQSKRITRKLNELRRDAWRRMHDPLADEHRWYVSVLRGHCAYYGMPHNWRALAGFRQAMRRIWFTCLKRRSQGSRRAGWDWFNAVTAPYPLPPVRITRSWAEQRIWRV